MLKIYHNQRCSKSRETCSLLDTIKEKYEIVEYLKTPPTAKELKEIVKMLGIKASELVRKKEPIFIEKYSGKKLTEAQWIKAMVENPILIERPIVVKNGKAIIGRPPELIKKLLIFLFLASLTMQAQDFYVPPLNNTNQIEISDYKVFSKNKTNSTIRASYKKVLFKNLYYLKTKDHLKIYPGETDSLFRIYGLNNKDTLKGYNNKGIWLFNIQNGPIKSYCEKPTPLIFYATSYKKNNSELIKDNNSFRNTILKEWVSDSPNAIKLWKKQRRRYVTKKIIGPSVVLACVAMAIFAPQDSPFSIVPALLIVPASVTFIAIKRMETSKIVDAYNSEMLSNKRKRTDFFKD